MSTTQEQSAPVAVELEPIRLLGLKIKNFNRVEVFEARFDGSGLVAIAGPNGNGKTSALDALEWAFAGARALPKGTSPIRHGTSKTEVLVETDKFVLERVQTPSGNRFNVEGLRLTGVGGKVSQATLDAFFSDLTFNPFGYAAMDPATQRAQLIRACGFEAKLDEIVERRRDVYDNRTAANRSLKTLRTQLEGLKEPDPFTPAEEESAAAIVAEIGEARRHVDARREVERNIESQRSALQASRCRIAALEAELELERAKASELGELVTASLAGLDAMAPAPDVATLEAKLAGVEQRNADARGAQVWRAKKREVEHAQAEVDELERMLSLCDADRAKLLGQVSLPIEGLRIEDDGVSLNGVPLAQASTAETVELGCAIAVALNPQLRVIRIPEGSLLDRSTREAIDRIAREKGFLVLAEVVADEPTGAENEIWICEGRTAA